MVEPPAHNRQVAGSTPAGSTILFSDHQNHAPKPARMAELADAKDLKSFAQSGVRVQSPLRAPNNFKGLQHCSPFFVAQIRHQIRTKLHQTPNHGWASGFHRPDPASTPRPAPATASRAIIVFPCADAGRHAHAAHAQGMRLTRVREGFRLTPTAAMRTQKKEIWCCQHPPRVGYGLREQMLRKICARRELNLLSGLLYCDC